MIQERKLHWAVEPVAVARAEDCVQQTGPVGAVAFCNAGFRRTSSRPLAAIVMSGGDAWLIGIVVMSQFNSPSWVCGATRRRAVAAIEDAKGEMQARDDARSRASVR